MAITSTTSIAKIERSTANEIYNLSTPLANTEYSQALNDNVKQLLIRVRGVAEAKFSFVSGESLTKYITIPAGTTYSASNLNLTSATLYINVSKSSQVVEIQEWT